MDNRPRFVIRIQQINPFYTIDVYVVVSTPVDRPRMPQPRLEVHRPYAPAHPVSTPHSVSPIGFLAGLATAAAVLGAFSNRCDRKRR